MGWAVALAYLLLTLCLPRAASQQVWRHCCAASRCGQYLHTYLRAGLLAPQGTNGGLGGAQHSRAPAPGAWEPALLAGRVLESEASCVDAWGSAAVTLVVRDLPPAFASATVTCKFLPAAGLRELGLVRGLWRFGRLMDCM